MPPTETATPSKHAEAPAPSRAPAGDPLTIGAIAVVAYALAAVVHEGAGHGGACVAVGGTPEMLNAIFFRCDEAGLAPSAARWVAAAGGGANLVVAGLLFFPLRAMRRSPGAAHYFLWLFFTINVLTAFGYLCFSGVGGFGDWHVVTAGLEPPVLYRAALVVAGSLLYFVVAPRLIMPDLNLYLGRDPAARPGRARRLAGLPYVVGGVTSVVASVFNPESALLVLLSAAAASFGGTSLLAWYPPTKWAYAAGAPERPAIVPRSVGWVAAGVVTLALFVGVLGPGIHL